MANMEYIYSISNFALDALVFLLKDEHSQTSLIILRNELIRISAITLLGGNNIPNDIRLQLSFSDLIYRRK